MQKQLCFTLISAFIIALGPLARAEVEEVTVTWNGFKCQSSCVSQMEQNLKSIPNATNVQVNPQGSAIMKWAPNQPFSYEPFRYAAGAIGNRFSSMRIKVKGTITFDGTNFFLISSGDNTQFLLVGPLLTQPGRYAPNNLQTHPITPATQDQLTRLTQSQRKVMISGPLLLPSYYQLALVTENIKEM